MKATIGWKSWRITAKKTDFYLDPRDEDDAFHLSIHGPNDKHDTHRFHIKVDRRKVAKARKRGYVMGHSILKDGFPFDGQQIAEGVYRVARIRWTWHLQRSRFRAAAVSGQAPDLADHQSGVRRSDPLSPNDAWDIDVVVSYERPYWPNPSGSLRDNARIEPLRNNAGLWLTATSYHRSLTKYPCEAGDRRPDLRRWLATDETGL